MTTPVVYRHYAGDELLYVGITNCIQRRTQEHLTSPWFGYVTSIHVEPCASIEEAGEIEKEVIACLSPPYNKDTGGHRPPRTRPPLTVLQAKAGACTFYLDGDKLRLARILKNETVRSLAKKSRVSAPTITNLERCIVNVRFHPSPLNKLAEALEVEPTELISGEGE